MKRFRGLMGALVLVSVVATAVPASAGVVTIGNNANYASTVDTYSNFTIVDTNNPAPTAGWITQINYYAANTGPMAFVVVNSSNTVQYVSPVFNPPAIGTQTWIPVVPIPVQEGWNVALYFGSSGGVIPFNYGGAAAAYTPNNNGLPTNGESLTIAGTSGRTYSFVATEDTSGTSGAQCKNGGWQSQFDPNTLVNFTNQGQCVSYFATMGAVPIGS